MAGVISAILPTRAFVVFVPSAFPRDLRHAGPADSAFEKSRQKRWRGDETRRRLPRRAMFPHGPYVLESGGLDEGGNRGFNPLRRRPPFTRPGIDDVEIVVPAIKGVGEDRVDFLNRPRLSPHQAPGGVQVLRDFLYAESAALVSM